MSTNKTAIITGANGQDGSYLSELLLEKGYRVVAMVRRSSVDNCERISHLRGVGGFNIIEGDVTDFACISNLINKYKPDEFYNLAAQSHVQTSFEQPFFTWEVNAVGVLNILEAIRNYNIDTRLLHCSTSEMFGKNYSLSFDGVKHQREDTPFAPQSPYAVSKVAAHQCIGLYRDAYKLYASTTISFNHETLTYNTPLIFKDSSGFIDILPIGDIVRYHTGLSFNMDGEYQEGKVTEDLFVWDQNDWTKVLFASGYPHKGDKNPRIINSRRSIYAATGNHVCIMDDDTEKETSKIAVNDRVKLIDLPNNQHNFEISLEYAEWLGMLVGDGNLHNNKPRFTNKDMLIKQHFVKLWESFVPNSSHVYKDSYSGFNGGFVGQVECYGMTQDFDIYTNEISPFGHKTKKVPKCILNGSKDVMEAFLIGYNMCDGLKKNSCKYRFKNFKTNSHTLACGLIYLISMVTGQKYNITVEESWQHGKQQFYYSINLLSDRQSSIDKYNIIKPMLDNKLSQREIYNKTGIGISFIRKVQRGYVPSNTHHLEKPINEVKKIIDIPNYNGWFFDLETESGTFHAGAGQGLVHNSPRRGENFVTRKITKWIGEFVKWAEEHPIIFENGQIQLWENMDNNYLYQGLAGSPRFPKLRLGNLDACRDWGHAKDTVRAMWLVLQSDKPDDYVVATGKTYSVHDFLKEAFGCIGIENYMDYVVQDPQFMRPAEVDYLLGDSGKIRRKLFWKPQIEFKDLVKKMVEYDIERAK